MKVYGGKKYEIITADSSYLVDKTFEAVDKKKFIVGEDIEHYGVLKINAPSGAIVTRNEDFTMYEEELSGEVYMVVLDGLDSVELPDGASAEIEVVADLNSLLSKFATKEYVEELLGVIENGTY